MHQLEFCVIRLLGRFVREAMCTNQGLLLIYVNNLFDLMPRQLDHHDYRMSLPVGSSCEGPTRVPRELRAPGNTLQKRKVSSPAPVTMD